jgi:hypothetical protein
MSEALRLTDFQRRVLAIPEQIDLFLGGGRGGGKSWAIGLLILRHCAQYRERARVLYLRRTYGGLMDFVMVLQELFAKAYPQGFRYNGSEHVFRLPDGGYVELGQLDDFASYSRYQGRSFTLLVFDEAGQYASPDLLDLMRSNLRGSKEIPLRVVMAANPAGAGHHWLARRYVFKAAPWTEFIEEKSGRTWISAPSTFLDNSEIDQDQYRAQLESSCPADPELLRAWLEGDWAVARGAYFAECLEESRVAVDPWPNIPTHIVTDRNGPREVMWDHWLAHDFGSSAPSATYLMARSPGAEFRGKFYPRDSVIVVDELVAHQRDNLNKGLGWTAAITAEAIIDFCKPWGVKPRGVADDAIFGKTGHTGSIADEFAAKGVTFFPAKKADRISGWQKMRRMLADAGKPDLPGLYVTRTCEYFWATVPYLARDQKRVEDVDSTGPDHGADAVRYGLMRNLFRTSTHPLRI